MRFLLTLFFYGSILSLQVQAQSYELPYPTDKNTPQWVQLMYADNPNVKSVMAAYKAYYATHKFEKNSHTQYYKRWLRKVLPYVNAKGFIEKPSREILDQQWANYLEKVEQAKVQKLSDGVWEEIGPWEYDHEAAMNLSVQSPGAAHIYTVEQSASNPDIVIAGTANAGLWKSTDKGLTWSPLTNELAVQEVYSAEIDHSTENTLYFSSIS